MGRVNFIVLLVLLASGVISISACGPRACSPDVVDEYLRVTAYLESQFEQADRAAFTAAYPNAGTAPSAGLDGNVSGDPDTEAMASHVESMEEILVEVQKMRIPECAQETHNNMIRYLSHAINAHRDLVETGNLPAFAGYRDLNEDRLQNFLQERQELLDLYEP